MSVDPIAVDVARVRQALHEAESPLVDLDVFPSTHDVPDRLPGVGLRRRLRRAGEPDPLHTASLLLNDDGVLLWHDAALQYPGTGMRRRRRGLPPAPDGDVVELYQYEPLAPNEIAGHLIKLDAKLNGRSGLSKLSAAPGSARLGAEPLGDVMPSGKRRRLLFIHGTFSSTDAYIEGIAKADNGADFCRRMLAHYDEVMAFDHATLSVSPALNAFDLARLLQRIDGPLDIVAHSRGGLVARWLLEGFGLPGQGPFRAVLVGAPMNGTSLASPPRLRSALSLISNIGTALKLGGMAASVTMPLLAAPVALLRVATSVVSVAAKTPLIDAAVQMVPGLAGQSRVGNNVELSRIRSVMLAKPPEYFAVQSNFETEAAGWRFWRWFRKSKLADTGADLIFQDRNDLVVDTVSMTELSPAAFPAANALVIPDGDDVHHCNYFEQAQTLDFILAKLGVP